MEALKLNFINYVSTIYHLWFKFEFCVICYNSYGLMSISKINVTMVI